MPTTYSPGQTLGRTDLAIYLTDTNSLAANAATISYALYYVDPIGPVNVLIGPPQRTPINPAVGEYYAALMIPPSVVAGNYLIQWTFQQFTNSTPQIVVQEFQVVIPSALNQVKHTRPQWEMINKLRLLLRDQNPDRNYRFRPPRGEDEIGRYDRVFGRIWEDSELLEYLERSLDWFNMFPPLTSQINTIDALVEEMPVWRTAILWYAIVFACFALSLNWVSEEFSYSIGGVNLDLEKSSKYESLKNNAEQQFATAVTAKVETTLFIRGLQQPRFGIGVRSAFGPYTGRGVLGPRAFV